MNQLFRVEGGFFDGNVYYISGAGAPGGDGSSQDNAPVGSQYIDKTSGLLYRKITVGTGTDKWDQVEDTNVSTLAEGSVLFVENDNLSAGTGFSFDSTTGTLKSPLVTIENAQPVLALKNTATFADNQWQLRVGFESDSRLDIYDVYSSKVRLIITNNGQVSIGEVEPPLETALYIYGGPQGANVDARASDQFQTATFEAQSYDFATTFKSVYIQHIGSGIFGDFFNSIPRANAAQLVFQGPLSNALIYTQDEVPLIFGTHYSEVMRLTTSGEMELVNPLGVAYGGTGATTPSAARTNLELGSLATVTPTGTPDGTKFLRDDNSWQTISAGGIWGSISGTLSNQTDLQSALDAKEPTFTKNTAFNKSFGTTSGTVAEGDHTHTAIEVTVPGSTRQILFNNGGSWGASSAFTWEVDGTLKIGSVAITSFAGITFPSVSQGYMRVWDTDHTESRMELGYATHSSVDAYFLLSASTPVYLYGDATGILEFNSLSVWHAGNTLPLGTTASSARTALELGSLAELSPTGTSDGSTFLRGDGTYTNVLNGPLQAASLRLDNLGNQAFYLDGSNLIFGNAVGSVIVSSGSDSILVSNAYILGGNWYRYDTTKPAIRLVAQNDGTIHQYSVGVGSGVITWTDDGEIAVGATGAAWGSITGTLSNQTDLMSALNDKEPTFSKNTAFNKNFGTAAGTVSEGNHIHPDYLSRSAPENVAAEWTFSGTSQTSINFDRTGSFGGMLRVDGTLTGSGSGGGIAFQSSGDVLGVMRGYITNGTSMGVGIISLGMFATTGASTATEAQRWNTDGTVSIPSKLRVGATSTPSNTLDVTGTIAATGEIYVNTSTEVGYRDIPLTTKNASATFALTDRGKGWLKNNTTAYTWSIPTNASVAFPIGSTITLVNEGSAGNVTIFPIAGVTLRLSGTTTTGTRLLGPYGSATILKVATNVWHISGGGVI